MTTKLEGGKETRGSGWVGRWQDGALGWFIPSHVFGYKNLHEPANDNENLKGERVYLCDIIIRQRFDKKGRPIVRIKK